MSRIAAWASLLQQHTTRHQLLSVPSYTTCRHCRRFVPAVATTNKPLLQHQRQGHCRRCLSTTTSMSSSNNDNMKDTTTTSTHYTNHTADSYEEAYFYEPGVYMEHLVQLIGTRLGLHQQQECIGNSGANTHRRRRILDMGGGTGNFAKALLETFNHHHTKEELREMIVVDPFLPPTTKTTGGASDMSPNDGMVNFVKAPAEAFLKPKQTSTEDDSWWRSDISQILLKEVVHHLEDDRVSIFRGMHQDLLPTTTMSSSTPSILIVTRPQVDIDYPLWNAARDVWKDNQPSSTLLAEELQQAGFVDIVTTVHAYPCSIALSKWQAMIQNRFWSTFSNFNDHELQQASQEIIPMEWKDRIDKNGILHFEDRLVFIAAYKR